MKPELKSKKLYTSLEVFEMVKRELHISSAIIGKKKLGLMDEIILNTVHSAFRRDEVITSKLSSSTDHKSTNS
jgi:hypothetical protein